MSVEEVAGGSQWIRHGVALVVILLVGAAVYANCLRIGFLSDDFDWFVLVESAEYSVFDPINTGTGLYFRPLITLSLRLDRAIASGVSPFFHHLSNLLIHLVNSVTVYLASGAISGRPRFSLGTALLFLLHPVVVANVYWARVDSLMAFFYLPGVLGYLYFLRSGRPVWLLLSMFGLVGSLLSKEMAVTFPLVLLVNLILFRLEIVPGAGLAGGRLQWALASVVGSFLLTAAYLGYLYIRFYRPASQNFLAFSPVDALEALLTSFIVLVLPNYQSLLITLYRAHPWLLILGLVMLAIGLLVVTVWLYRRGGRRGLLLMAALASLYLVTLPPLLVSGVESRQMYLPLAMLCLVISFLPHFQPVMAGHYAWCLYLLAIIMAAVSYGQGRIWVNNWQLADAYCQSFRTLTRTISAETPILFLTTPYEFRNVPIFTNDLNAALFHCRFGRFGYFPHLTYVSSLVAQQEAPAANDIIVAQEQRHTFHVSLQAADTYFYFGPGLAPGDRLVADDTPPWPPMSVIIDSLNGRDQVTAFTFTLVAPEESPPLKIFYFNGAEFSSLK